MFWAIEHEGIYNSDPLGILGWNLCEKKKKSIVCGHKMATNKNKYSSVDTANKIRHLYGHRGKIP